MLEHNTPFSYLVEFTSGAPTGVFSYSLYDEDGNIVDGIENVEIPLGIAAVSATIAIPASANIVTKPLFERRTIVWSYPTGSGVVTDSYSYSLQKTVPFPVTNGGVRTLLGVTENEVPDERINLLGAYIALQDIFIDPTALTPYETAGDRVSFKITKAIEALAALELLPTLQLSLARRLNSGTNEYERWNRIDWEGLKASLESIVIDTTLLVDPTLTFDVVPIFTLSIRTDPLTGA